MFMFIKMSLNSLPSTVPSVVPCAKLSFNINAFNGNTTNFNRASCPSPKAKIPHAPLNEPTTWVSTTVKTGLVRPL